MRFYFNLGQRQRWGIFMPWYLVLILYWLWLLGFAVVLALWLVWQILRWPLKGIDALCKHYPSNLLKLAWLQFSKPQSFDEARNQALSRSSARKEGKTAR
jgi:hypothetical protein